MSVIYTTSAERSFMTNSRGHWSENNVIHESFKFGKNLKMGHYCVIGEDVVVGDNVVIENYVLLKKGTIIGSDTFIDSYVRSSGYNTIGDNVTLRFGCTIAREVTIKNGAFVSPNVMTIYSTHKGEKKSGTVIGAEVHIGTAAVIGPGLKIASGAVIGAGGIVTNDCPVAGIYRGAPARLIEIFK